jgi:hypothetical protein
MTISHFIIYPLEVTKTRIAIYNFNYKGILDCIQKTVSREGVLSLYKGLLPSWFSFIPSTTVNISIYTTIRDYYIKLKK